MIVTVYSSVDGSVLSELSGDVEFIEMQIGVDEAYVEGSYLHGYRFDLNTENMVPLLDYDVVVTRNTISGIPPGTEVAIEHTDVSYVVHDGVIEFDAVYDQKLRVVMTHPHYNDAVVEVLCAGEA